MAKKKQEDHLSVSTPLETYLNDGNVKYIISRTKVGEYYFLVPAEDGLKLIASSHSGAFEKERKKWAK